MDNIAEYLDHRRWLLGHGIATDDIKNNLFMYGSVVHLDIQAVECSIDAMSKTVNYVIYAPNRLLKRIESHNNLIKKHKENKLTTLEGWRFRRTLVKMKKNGERLDFENVLSQFVKDYCGKQWKTTCEVKNVKEYNDDANEQES